MRSMAFYILQMLAQSHFSSRILPKHLCPFGLAISTALPISSLLVTCQQYPLPKPKILRSRRQGGGKRGRTLDDGHWGAEFHAVEDFGGDVFAQPDAAVRGGATGHVTDVEAYSAGGEAHPVGHGSSLEASALGDDVCTGVGVLNDNGAGDIVDLAVEI